MPHKRTRRSKVVASSASEGKSLRAVMLEVRGLSEYSADAAEKFVEGMCIGGCSLDRDFEPVHMEAGATQIIRCILKNERVADDLRKHPNVVAIWKDTEIAPLGNTDPH